MSLPTNNKKEGRQGNKALKNAAVGSKFIAGKASKGASVSKKPVKTGGSRGS